METRLATLHDLNDLNHLLRLSKSYWGYDNEFMNKFMSELAITESYLTNSNTFIVSENHKMIGFYSFSQNHNDDFELDNLFLHPTLIGIGKGKEVWKLCLQTALQYGAKEFIVWSDPNAEGFYYKMGCKKIGERESPMILNRYSPVLKYIINNK